jgi:MFS family permease
VLLASLVLFGASGSIGGLLGSLPAITVSRAALGLAAGGIGTTATTLIVDYYDEAQSRILGGQAASASAGVVLAGGLALLLLGWMAVCRLPPRHNPILAPARGRGAERGGHWAETQSSLCNA